MRRIKSEKIVLRGGVPAILSTVEIAPGEYESMVMSPDGEEYDVIKTTTERAAMKNHKYLKRTHHRPPLSGKYAKLAQDLKEAAAYGLEVSAGDEDGGTCNFDSPALFLKGWRDAMVEQAAEAAGLSCSTWNFYGKACVFSVPGGYQGNARTTAAEAMRDFLLARGYDATMYYQMD